MMAKRKKNKKEVCFLRIFERKIELILNTENEWMVKITENEDGEYLEYGEQFNKSKSKIYSIYNARLTKGELKMLLKRFERNQEYEKMRAIDNILRFRREAIEAEL